MTCTSLSELIHEEDVRLKNYLDLFEDTPLILFYTS